MKYVYCVPCQERGEKDAWRNLAKWNPTLDYCKFCNKSYSGNIPEGKGTGTLPTTSDPPQHLAPERSRQLPKIHLAPPGPNDLHRGPGAWKKVGSKGSWGWDKDAEAELKASLGETATTTTPAPAAGVEASCMAKLVEASRLGNAAVLECVVQVLKPPPPPPPKQPDPVYEPTLSELARKGELLQKDLDKGLKKLDGWAVSWDAELARCTKIENDIIKIKKDILTEKKSVAGALEPPEATRQERSRICTLSFLEDGGPLSKD